MKTPTYVLHLVDDDFDIHFVPHSKETDEAIKRKASAKGKSIREYLLDQTALMVMLGVVDPEEEETTA